MTAVKTIQIRIINPKAECLIDDLASLDLIEIDESTETDELEEAEETPREWFSRWSREAIERQEREGPPFEDPPLSMKEIVAICKEARAEMYAEEQEQKMAACR
jgi:hypothetical protein